MNIPELYSYETGKPVYEKMVQAQEAFKQGALIKNDNQQSYKYNSSKTNKDYTKTFAYEEKPLWLCSDSQEDSSENEDQHKENNGTQDQQNYSEDEVQYKENQENQGKPYYLWTDSQQSSSSDDSGDEIENGNKNQRIANKSSNRKQKNLQIKQFCERCGKDSKERNHWKNCTNNIAPPKTQMNQQKSQVKQQNVKKAQLQDEEIQKIVQKNCKQKL